MSEEHVEHVQVSCHYDHPPETIFDAWIDPAMVSKWLFIGPTSELTTIDINPTVGGKFSILEFERTNNEFIDHFGTYTEVEHPLRLAFTLYVPKHFPGETTVTIHIFPTLNGCEVKLTQTGVSKEIAEKDWHDMLHHLKDVLPEE